MSFNLTIGSAPLEADIFNSGATGDSTFTANNLPQDNSTLYVTLWYWDGIEFKNIEYTYVSKKFPWALFLPAITTHHECSKNYLGLCKEQSTCEGVGGYWWNKQCNTSMSSSQVFMARLAGNIHFTYNLSGIDWNEYYFFDIKTLKENAYQTGGFEIYGTDAYGNKVKAYEYGLNAITGSFNYIFINEGFSTLDERFVFHWENSTDLSGLIRVKDKSENSWENSVYTHLYGSHSK